MLAAFLLLGAGTQPADPDDDDAEVQVRAPEPSVESYDVRGLSMSALRDEVEAKGPEGGAGTSRVGLRFEATQRSNAKGACEVATVRVIAETRILLPSWIDKGLATRDLKDRWACLYRALEEHERGHARIHVENAQEVARALKGTPPQANCVDLAKEVTRRFDAAKAASFAKQQAFDRDTDHGRKERRACE
ncbi:hypothetical protein BWI17_05575 [Betaproteobacteria bacterium GR16-43]|nr:hypothetical protein BWI17_05575 [Betaproteobacteria bacterium GR16-43]